MKKQALTGLLICCTLAVFGQTAATTDPMILHNKGSLRMALSGAPVFSWFQPSGEVNTVDRRGIRFSVKYGLHMDFRMSHNDNYFFSTGIFMVNTGGGLRHDWALPNPSNPAELWLTRRTVDYRINYLTVPLNFKLMTNEVGYTRYFARVGFDMGMAVHSRFDSEDEFLQTRTVASRENASAEDNTRWLRTALHIEGGLEFNISGDTNLMVSLEWNNGLSNIFKSDVRLPTGENTAATLDGPRLESSLNYVAINLGVYF